MTEAHPEGITTFTVSQDQQACRLHTFHSPVTVVNELHHVFPQEWQKAIWGEVRDQEKWSICSTAHNTVHAALREYDRTGAWPRWCSGTTRDLAEIAVTRRAAASSEL